MKKLEETPLIITCAVMGAELSLEDYPYLPSTPDQLAKSAIDAVKAGASIIHLHVRDSSGLPSQDSNIFKEVTNKIFNECECIIQYSTGGAVGTPVNLRCSPLKLKPHMATLSMGTMNFGQGIFENSIDTITQISAEIQKYNIVPELEIFDFGMLETTYQLLKKNIIPSKFHIDFVLGVPGGLNGEIYNLIELTRRLPDSQTWSVAGVGKYQLPLSMTSIALGGHVRVGIEDNIYFTKGVLAKYNSEYVKRVVRLAHEANRPIASVDDAKKILL